MGRRGFTIIELLVAISIILLLIAAAALNIDSARKNGRDARRLSDILVIAKSVDQSATLNRSTYPRSVPSSASASMCANEIAPSSTQNTNGIDLSLFPHRSVPTDPLAVTPLPTGCTSMLNGYTYHTEYNHLSGTPNYATRLQLGYVLEVGLENSRPADEPLFKMPSELSLPGGGSTSEDSASGRARYLLVGPYCGSSCYN